MNKPQYSDGALPYPAFAGPRSDTSPLVFDEDRLDTALITHSTTRQLLRYRGPLLVASLLLVLSAFATSVAQAQDGEAPSYVTETPADDSEEDSESDDDTSSQMEDEATETPLGQTANVETATDESAKKEVRTDNDEEYFGLAHRERMYEEAKLSTSNALLYTLALPGIGNIYAEQYLLAGLAFSFMAFTIMFVTYGLTTQQPQFVHMGFVTGGTAYVGGAITSVIGVKRYNARLRESFNFDERSERAAPFDMPRARTVNVTIRF